MAVKNKALSGAVSDSKPGKPHHDPRGAGGEAIIFPEPTSVPFLAFDLSGFDGGDVMPERPPERSGSEPSANLPKVMHAPSRGGGRG